MGKISTLIDAVKRADDASGANKVTEAGETGSWRDPLNPDEVPMKQSDESGSWTRDASESRKRQAKGAAAGGAGIGIGAASTAVGTLLSGPGLIILIGFTLTMVAKSEGLIDLPSPERALPS